MNVSKAEICDAAEAALRERKKVRPRLLGYCFENAEALSKELYEREIPHELEYVGLKNLIFQEQQYDLNLITMMKLKNLTRHFDVQIKLVNMKEDSLKHEKN